MFVTVKNIDADSLRYLRCMVKRRCKITINFPNCSRFLKKITFSDVLSHILLLMR